VLEQDLSYDELPSPSLQRLREEGLRARMLVPLLLQGRLIGVIHLAADRPYALTADQESLMHELADHLAIGLQNTRLLAEVQAANTRLYTLSRQLIEAQEAERRRIARELHDNLSQQMALLAIEIEQIASQAGRSQQMARAMRELGERTAEIASEIHTMSHRLHSSKLEALGLAAAVRGHCREVLAQGIRVEFSEVGVPESVSHDVQLCLFRVVQEGLTNVVKHSGAREANVTLIGARDALLLSVSDCGRGFEEVDAADRDGLGLASMRERVRLIGGELTISSRSGHGTMLAARVPLTSSRGQSALVKSAQVA